MLSKNEQKAKNPDHKLQFFHPTIDINITSNSAHEIPNYNQNNGSCLTTDLYQYTMAFAYFHQMKTKGIAIPQTSFDMYYRTEPFKGGYGLFCGLRTAVEYMSNFRFDRARLEYLKSIFANQVADKEILDEFIEYLATVKPKFSVWSVKDSTPVHANQLVMRVETDALFAQIWETPLLSIVGYATLVATNTSRIVQAAKGKAILEFGARRAQSDFGIMSSLYSYYGGALATSNVEAGFRYQIPVRGTHSHAWVMLSKSEQEAFDHYSDAFPDGCILLVDTFDPIKGVEKAIQTGLKLREKGKDLAGIRIDSGGDNMANLISQARAMLDAAGFTKSMIVASDDLDEDKIDALLKQGAPIDSFGVGTRLVTCTKQPAMGMVYKANALLNAETNEWEHKMKICSPEKQSIPARKNVARYYDPQTGKCVASVVYDINNPPKQNEACEIVDPKTRAKTTLSAGYRYESLLVPIFIDGKLVYDIPTPEESRKHGLAELAKIPDDMLALKNPKGYPIGITRDLQELTEALVKQIQSQPESTHSLDLK